MPAPPPAPQWHAGCESYPPGSEMTAASNDGLSFMYDQGSSYPTCDLSLGHSFVNHQIVANQARNNTIIFSNASMQDSTFAAEVFVPAESNTLSDFVNLDSSLLNIFGGSTLYESHLQSLTPAPEVAVQAPKNNANNLQAAATNIATVQETTDGRFRCSEGCPTWYGREGDCRCHLKKHNGPFFPCSQRGCDMEFYRHDKLRDHLKQGHGIVVSAPGNKRRQRGVAAH